MIKNDLPRYLENLRAFTDPQVPLSNLEAKEVSKKELEAEALMKELEAKRDERIKKLNELIFKGKPKEISKPKSKEEPGGVGILPPKLPLDFNIKKGRPRKECICQNGYSLCNRILCLIPR